MNFSMYLRNMILISPFWFQILCNKRNDTRQSFRISRYVQKKQETNKTLSCVSSQQVLIFTSLSERVINFFIDTLSISFNFCAFTEIIRKIISLESLKPQMYSTKIMISLFSLKRMERWQGKHFWRRQIHECNIDDNFVVMDYDLFQLCYPTHYFGIHLLLYLIRILDFAGSNFARK